jgi:hypothetical protein
MAATYEARHLREDNAEPCPALAQALARRASGSTHARAANEDGVR